MKCKLCNEEFNKALVCPIRQDWKCVEQKIFNTYKLVFTDGSFMIVDENYVLNLFNKHNYKDKQTIKICEFIASSQNFLNYCLLSKQNGSIVQKDFMLIKDDNLKNLPLDTIFKNIAKRRTFKCQK